MDFDLDDLDIPFHGEEVAHDFERGFSNNSLHHYNNNNNAPLVGDNPLMYHTDMAGSGYVDKSEAEVFDMLLSDIDGTPPPPVPPKPVQLQQINQPSLSRSSPSTNSTDEIDYSFLPSEKERPRHTWLVGVDFDQRTHAFEVDSKRILEAMKLFMRTEKGAAIAQQMINTHKSPYQKDGKASRGLRRNLAEEFYNKIFDIGIPENELVESYGLPPKNIWKSVNPTRAWVVFYSQYKNNLGRTRIRCLQKLGESMKQAIPKKGDVLPNVSVSSSSGQYQKKIPIKTEKVFSSNIGMSKRQKKRSRDAENLLDAARVMIQQYSQETRVEIPERISCLQQLQRQLATVIIELQQQEEEKDHLNASDTDAHDDDGHSTGGGNGNNEDGGNNNNNNNNNNSGSGGGGGNRSPSSDTDGDESSPGSPFGPMDTYDLDAIQGLLIKFGFKNLVDDYNDDDSYSETDEEIIPNQNEIEESKIIQLLTFYQKNHTKFINKSLQLGKDLDQIPKDILSSYTSGEKTIDDSVLSNSRKYIRENTLSKLIANLSDSSKIKSSNASKSLYSTTPGGPTNSYNVTTPGGPTKSSDTITPGGPTNSYNIATPGGPKSTKSIPTPGENDEEDDDDIKDPVNDSDYITPGNNTYSTTTPGGPNEIIVQTESSYMKKTQTNDDDLHTLLQSKLQLNSQPKYYGDVATPGGPDDDDE